MSARDAGGPDLDQDRDAGTGSKFWFHFWLFMALANAIFLGEAISGGMTIPACIQTIGMVCASSLLAERAK